MSLCLNREQSARAQVDHEYDAYLVDFAASSPGMRRVARGRAAISGEGALAGCGQATRVGATVPLWPRSAALSCRGSVWDDDTAADRTNDTACSTSDFIRKRINRKNVRMDLSSRDWEIQAPGASTIIVRSSELGTAVSTQISICDIHNPPH